jgi:hypothetical protein
MPSPGKRHYLPEPGAAKVLCGLNTKGPRVILVVREERRVTCSACIAKLAEKHVA